MSEWEPKQFHKDPMVNAVLNVAESLSRLAEATDGLLYGLKYSRAEGTSVAEAIENAAQKVASGLSSVSEALADNNG
jgi:hypothetical protein